MNSWPVFGLFHFSTYCKVERLSAFSDIANFLVDMHGRKQAEKPRIAFQAIEPYILDKAKKGHF